MRGKSTETGGISAIYVKRNELFTPKDKKNTQGPAQYRPIIWLSMMIWSLIPEKIYRHQEENAGRDREDTRSAIITKDANFKKCPQFPIYSRRQEIILKTILDTHRLGVYS